jgi:hypothetical protein
LKQNKNSKQKNQPIVDRSSGVVGSVLVIRSQTIDRRVMSSPLAWACYLLRLNLPSDTGILVRSYEILYHEDGTTVIDFRLLLALLSSTVNLGVEAVPLNNSAAKVQYQTGTT